MLLPAVHQPFVVPSCLKPEHQQDSQISCSSVYMTFIARLCRYCRICLLHKTPPKKHWEAKGGCPSFISQVSNISSAGQIHLVEPFTSSLLVLQWASRSWGCSLPQNLGFLDPNGYWQPHRTLAATRTVLCMLLPGPGPTAVEPLVWIWPAVQVSLTPLSYPMSQ